MHERAVRHAVGCLARAERLSGIADVSGPADALPNELTSAWLGDWVERAKKGLERAWDDARKEAEDVRERAKKVAENVQSGARALASLPSKAVDTVRDALERLIEVAQRIQWTFTASTVIASIIMAAGFARYMGWL